LEPLRYLTSIKGFKAVIFRRTTPQIKLPGGLWDTSMELYPLIGATPIDSLSKWKFPFDNSLKFSHLEYEKNIKDWQGSQVPFIAFDELTHFSRKMFFYLLSRNRSACGVKPYVRATCNPDPDSWVANFIEWWIDQDPDSNNYGFPIVERCGKLRYFISDAGNLIWRDTPEEVIIDGWHIIEKQLEKAPKTDPYSLVKSVTFIPGSIYDNQKLLEKDPGYLGNLMAQDENTKAALLDGNWKIKTDGSALINLVKMKDSFSNEFVERGQKWITADIAMKGSDLLVIGVCYPWRS
jgi:hypothetical protein